VQGIRLLRAYENRIAQQGAPAGENFETKNIAIL